MQTLHCLKKYVQFCWELLTVCHSLYKFLKLIEEPDQKIYLLIRTILFLVIILFLVTNHLKKV